MLWCLVVDVVDLKTDWPDSGAFTAANVCWSLPVDFSNRNESNVLPQRYEQILYAPKFLVIQLY